MSTLTVGDYNGHPYSIHIETFHNPPSPDLKFTAAVVRICNKRRNDAEEQAANELAAAEAAAE